MIQVLDVEALGIPVIVLPENSPSQAGGVSEPAPACSPCAAYRPAPQPDGNLVVDPEIHLPSPGMDVDIGYYYNAVSLYNGPFGYKRSLSPNLLAQASGSPAIVTLTRGDTSVVSYQYNAGSGEYVPQTPGLLNSLVEDTTDNLWKETTLDGVVTAYPLDTAGHVTSATYIQDAVGNTHTLSYSGGRLSTIEEGAGRRVTFGYDTNHLLQSIEDWAGRITTLSYDTTTFSGQPVLTEVTGPTGCQTQYQYTSITPVP